MLCLARKVGEKILIGNDIEIVVTKIGGGHVTFGINAPKQTKILRGELQQWNAKAKEGETNERV